MRKEVQSSPAVTSQVLPRPAVLFETNSSINFMLIPRKQNQTVGFDIKKIYSYLQKIYKEYEIINK